MMRLAVIHVVGRDIRHTLAQQLPRKLRKKAPSATSVVAKIIGLETALQGKHAYYMKCIVIREIQTWDQPEATSDLFRFRETTRPRTPRGKWS